MEILFVNDFMYSKVFGELPGNNLFALLPISGNNCFSNGRIIRKPEVISKKIRYIPIE